MTPYCLVVEYQRSRGTFHLFGREGQYVLQEVPEYLADYMALQHKQQHGTNTNKSQLV
jgi:hypothetical protein